MIPRENKTIQGAIDKMNELAKKYGQKKFHRTTYYRIIDKGSCSNDIA